MNRRLCTMLFSLALMSAATASALAASAPMPPDEDSAYTAGTRAMNENRWADAIAVFDQVVDAKGKKADAALYWKAYSLVKLDKPQLAAETCRQLAKGYRASQWNRDCTALRLTLPLAAQGGPANWSNGDPYHFDFNFDFAGVSGRSKDPDTDLKMLALNSLAHRDPAQAMPLLRSMLAGNQTLELKQHALFVLTQSNSPEAQALLQEVIAGKQGPVLQRQAIQAAGLFEGRRLNDQMAEAYRTSNDPQIKRAVISAFFISGDDARMVELAKAEKNLEMKRMIVSQLSLMKGKAASDYMLELLK